LTLDATPGERFHVVTHGNEHKLLADADALADFLGAAVLER